MIRAGEDSSAHLRAQAAEMLANAVHRGGGVIISSESCMVSCVGAFCMDRHAPVIHDACAVLCAAAKRDAWGPSLELGFVVDCLGTRLFQLCCSLDGPQVRRTDDEELLVAKMFELAWRLMHHRRCGAFEMLCELEGHKCVLTAAISYIYDPRAQECRNLRHYRDGPVSEIHPSGLDCCLRMMEGMALYDARRDSPRRLLRAADASRALRATHALTANEKISCEVLVVTASSRPKQ